MVEAREHASFSLESLPPLFTFKEFFRQDLDRDRSVDARVLRPVDLARSPRAEEREDFVRAEAGAGCEAHSFVDPS